MTVTAEPTMPAHTCPQHGLYFGHSCPACSHLVAPPLEARHASPAPDAEASESPANEARRAGRYDAAGRREAKRTGRERGCWVYIPLDELEKTGVDLDGPPPFYRVWGAARGSCVVRFYTER